MARVFCKSDFRDAEEKSGRDWRAFRESLVGDEALSSLVLDRTLIVLALWVLCRRRTTITCAGGVSDSLAQRTHLCVPLINTKGWQSNSLFTDRDTASTWGVRTSQPARRKESLYSYSYSYYYFFCLPENGFLEELNHIYF